MYYILFYKTVENFIERRALYRQEHLDYAEAAYERGVLVMAGALDEPADSAVFVFKGDESSVAKEFAIHDPYVKNDLITEWQVRPWTVVIGG